MTRRTFNQIAYAALEVCNALERADLAACVARTGLAPGARALDIGTGNGVVAALLAADFGFDVDAVELDPGMAELARGTLDAAGVGDRVRVHVARSADVLAGLSGLDLICVIGATEPVGGGVREPQAIFEGLRPHLRDGGQVIWGDLFWKDAPPAPLRQVVDMTNTYASHDGWQAAARAAGYEVVSAEASGEETWDRYVQGMDVAARAWLDAHPEAEERRAVEASADRVKAMFDFGRPWLGFGLYLFRKIT